MTEERIFADKKISVLFTCVGRRVSLLRDFRKAADNLGVDITIIGVENNPLSPALYECDKKYLVNTIAHPNYIDELIEIIRSDKVDMIIPTIDLDLKILSENKAIFQENGCRLLLSSRKVVEICQDKRKTQEFLASEGFDYPRLVDAEMLESVEVEFPVFLKPWNGSASKGNARADDPKELEFYSSAIKNCIIQEFVKGDEYTCDAYVDFDMKVRCVVPRKRIEVRSGEVSKGRVCMNEKIIKQVKTLVEKLGAGPGVVTIQLFLTDRDEIKFIEINPRFGGGVPLSIKAGANFPEWLLTEILNDKPVIEHGKIMDGLAMLRFDSEIWINKEGQRI